MTIAGKNVVITGGSGSLGLVVVQAFVQHQSTVSIPVRDATKKVPGAGFVAECDLVNETQVRLFFESVDKRVGPTDVLVCLAGGYTGGLLVEETSTGDLEDQFRMNFLSAHNAIRMVLPGMKSRNNGRIVTIAAMPAVRPTSKREAYAVSKGAIVTLTEVVAEEVRGTGVTCNAIAPSIIRTKTNAESMPKADTSRWVGADEIASLILFLSSVDARSINGNVIEVFGGV